MSGLPSDVPLTICAGTYNNNVTVSALEVSGDGLQSAVVQLVGAACRLSLRVVSCSHRAGGGLPVSTLFAGEGRGVVAS
eukprot:3823535-Prymnesium_polylepis.1